MSLSGANIVESVYNDRALLLENDGNLKPVYEEHLELSGFEVHCAGNLAQARNVLEYLPVNLIVCNEFLAGGNTLEFLASLRNEGIQSSIVVMTEDEDRVWEHIPEQETALQTFPIPQDLQQFLKSDINQFVSLVTMVLDTMRCVLLVTDCHAEAIEVENVLITNNYRVCSVRDGQYALKAIQSAAPTHHPVDVLVFDILNRYYPGFMFLADLLKCSINLPSVVITDTSTSVEKIKSKTGFEVSDILPKNNLSSDLIPLIEQLILNN